jgi:hypothetical protein
MLNGYKNGDADVLPIEGMYEKLCLVQTELLKSDAN